MGTGCVHARKAAPRATARGRASSSRAAASLSGGAPETGNPGEFKGSRTQPVYLGLSASHSTRVGRSSSNASAASGTAIILAGIAGQSLPRKEVVEVYTPPPCRPAAASPDLSAHRATPRFTGNWNRECMTLARPSREHHASRFDGYEHAFVNDSGKSP
jgi:hypothetical protein